MLTYIKLCYNILMLNIISDMLQHVNVYHIWYVTTSLMLTYIISNMLQHLLCYERNKIHKNALSWTCWFDEVYTVNGKLEESCERNEKQIGSQVTLLSPPPHPPHPPHPTPPPQTTKNEKKHIFKKRGRRATPSGRRPHKQLGVKIGNVDLLQGSTEGPVWTPWLQKPSPMMPKRFNDYANLSDLCQSIAHARLNTRHFWLVKSAVKSNSWSKFCTWVVRWNLISTSWRDNSVRSFSVLNRLNGRESWTPCCWMV